MSEVRKRIIFFGIGFIGVGVVFGIIVLVYVGIVWGFIGGFVGGGVGVVGVFLKGFVSKRVVSEVMGIKKGNIYFMFV